MSMVMFYWIQEYAMECKCAGSLCILFGTGCFALNLNRIYEQRKHQLFDLYSALLQLKNDLQFDYNLLPVCFEKLKESAKQPFGEWFGRMERAIKENEQVAFNQIWTNETNWLLQNSSLTKEDLLPVFDLGDKLSDCDMNIKMHNIDSVLLHLDKQRKNYEKELGQKKKVSTTFCMFAGMLVLIIFF